MELELLGMFYFVVVVAMLLLFFCTLQTPTGCLSL